MDYSALLGARLLALCLVTVGAVMCLTNHSQQLHKYAPIQRRLRGDDTSTTEFAVDVEDQDREGTFMMTTTTTATTTSSTSAAAKWSHVWPAASDGSCRCAAVPWGEFASEDECMAHPSPSGKCTPTGISIDINECMYAVSKSEAVDNDQCLDLCVVASGDNGQNQEEFHNFCSFEKYTVTSSAVRPVDALCFSNIVIGHSDWSYSYPATDLAVAFSIFPDTLTAAQCQLHCQQDQRCTSWLWRRLPEDVNEATAQNTIMGLPLTCYLKDEAMAIGAANTVVPVKKMLTGDVPATEDPVWQYCDLTRNWEDIADNYSSGEVEECVCGCTWRSVKHLSGPKRCATEG